MTERLYLVDSYLQTVRATVIACQEWEGGYAVELDRTVFYPTGGGQPCDLGALGAATVAEVTEQGGRVLHIVSTPLEPGEAVACGIDWGRRFDHMQQHSGEHLLSFAVKELFGAANVGFHMSAAHCTIDLDLPLTREQLEAAEARANALVCQNLAVLLKDVDAEELPGLELRKRAEGLEGTVRIVYMPGGDRCTCCGTHVARTGEIGLIAVTDVEPHKGGVRVSFACGPRAVAYLQGARSVLEDVAHAYSCKREDVPQAVQSLKRELSDIKREHRALQTKLVRAVSRELNEEARPVKGKRLIARLVDLPPSQLRPLALALCEAGGTLAFLLAQSEEGVQYVLCCSEGLGLDMGELAQSVNPALQARGGGRGCLAQGFSARVSGLEGSIEQLAGYMERRLEALGR
ncbi:MAG: DHHA1 domain-containing protein [Clostridia bacterium]|nr:DHHA1 domain-containing protein [Clostridia bacterium]